MNMNLYREVQVITLGYTNEIINSMLIYLGIYGISLQIICSKYVSVHFTEY